MLGSTPDTSKFPHATRWYSHIKSYAAEHGSLPGTSTAGEAFAAGAAPAAAPAAVAEDDDEVDLFGSDEEDDAEVERVKAERVAAYNAKKAGKVKPAAKVRPYLQFIFSFISELVYSLLLLLMSSLGMMKPTWLP